MSEYVRYVRPQRIVMPPRLEKSHRRGAATTMFLLCDNGVEYTIGELSKIVGFAHSHGLYQRLRNPGWDSPDVLKPPCRRGYRIGGGTTSDGGGCGMWAKLSNKDRSANLRKIKPVGSWERRLL